MRFEFLSFAPHGRMAAAAGFVAFGAAWLFYAWPWLSGAATVPWDAKNHFYPMLRFLAASLAEGQSPDWSPQHYSGHPMIADPQSLIFTLPYRLLAAFVAVPTFREQDVVELLTLLVGGLGLVLFFREKGWGTVPGLLATAIFIFGGSASARLQHIGQIFSYSAIPLALWAAERFLRKRDFVSGLLLGVMGAQLAIGRDQVALMGCFLVAAYLFVGLAGLGRKSLRASGPLALGGLTAALLLAVPLGLTFAFAEISNRPGITYSNAALGSLHPAAFLTGIVPDLFNARADLSAYWGPGAAGWRNPSLWCDRAFSELYAGVMPAVLFVAAGLFGGRAFATGARFFLIALVLFTVYALGSFTPGFRLFYDHVPGVTLFRRPSDTTFHMILCLSVLAGYALHRLSSGSGPSLGRAPLAASLAVFAGLFGAAAWLAASAGKLEAVAPVLGRGAAMVLAAHGLVWLIARRPRLRGPGALAILAFAAADAAFFNTASGLNSEPPRVYAELDPRRSDPLAERLKSVLKAGSGPDRRDRTLIFGVSGPWQNAPLAHGIESAFAYNPLRWSEYQQTIARSDNSHFGGHAFTPLFSGYRSTLAKMLGLRYVVTTRPVEEIDKTLKPGDMPLLATIDKVRVYENPGVFPRAFFASNWIQGDFDEMIRTGAWPEADLRRTVVLDEPPPEDAVIGGATAKVGIKEYRNTDVTIDVQTDKSGFLVLNDIWSPWWRVEIDGRPATLLRANVLFRAVLVPPGRHVVRFKFEPMAAFEDWLRTFSLDES